jgi:hypothetical protein
MWDTEEWANYLGFNGFPHEANELLVKLGLEPAHQE